MSYGSVSSTQASQAADSEIYQLRPWHLLIICAALFAQEVVITNELIYMVTWEKLLGVPLEYVSLSGVISGIIGFISIPLMGRFGDKGNRLRRKTLLVIGSGCCILLGSCCIFVGFIIKLLVLHNYDNSHPSLSAWNQTCQNQNVEYFVNETSLNETNSQILLDPEYMFQDDPLSRLTSVLAVATFVFIDYGFDTGSPNIRSYMLECVHKSQHSKVLSVGVIMSGLGGCLVSIIGLSDFNFTAEQETDPNLLKAIALSFLLMVSVVITFPTTLIYGRYLLHQYDTRTKEDGERNNCGCSHEEDRHTKHLYNSQKTSEQLNPSETNAKLNYSKFPCSALQKTQNVNVDLSENVDFKTVQSEAPITFEHDLNIKDKKKRNRNLVKSME
ncbi:hypothetical protein BgiMline_002295 [Biomphalaria glabrata]|uniref:Uncharacterized protein LOC106063456 n=1 Tax=Biomphalaria glabrata TaxID=6526 RepID=A0A9W3AU34_BIOGL|nr:uncharacterized protein LOC106063456 [Biomphalaria glabrata]KAI8770142.1 membrane-associated transporter protein [Biomphalaria glabrata]